MISALFVRNDSIYKDLGVDSWDIDRNALNWAGGNAIIAHPPCRAWGKLRGLAKPRPGEKELAIWAIGQIRRYGGVLEHPRHSLLWSVLNLPKGLEIDNWGGYSVCVNQSWFGHKAEKNTLLYIVGCPRKELPAIPLRMDAITHTVNRDPRGIKKELSKKAREATPIDFAKWLIRVAEIADKNMNKNLNRLNGAK
jgi:hypothetical protein